MPRTPRRPATRLAVVIASAGLVLSVATACAPGGDSGQSSAPSGSSAPPTSTADASPPPTTSGGPSATPSSAPTATTPTIALPTDCKSMVSGAVLTYFGTTPLNDPQTGVVTGPQPDGSLICLWRDPSADTTYLMTTISRENRGPALELLNGLADTQGFTCFTPDGGTRCEKTWQNATYPVTDGRTLFWRDDILIDTSYSNVAPPDYTASIISALWG